jgi:hypothetical protein
MNLAFEPIWVAHGWVKQIKKYGYREKKPFVFAILSGKVGIFRCERRKMPFSNSRKNYYN